MDHQRGEDVMSDATEKVGNIVTDLGAKAEKIVQDKVDQGKSVLRDLQEGAAAAVDKTADLARKVSAPAGSSVSRYTAEQPLTALLIAGAIGYGLAYLIHRS
jgi:ElaB/YqjD/DUF883 family membrane-anchored ribosome-binding protein